VGKSRTSQQMFASTRQVEKKLVFGGAMYIVRIKYNGYILDVQFEKEEREYINFQIYAVNDMGNRCEITDLLPESTIDKIVEVMENEMERQEK